MLQAIGCENYLGIKRGELRDLTQIVVLVGPNGCGKSTMLDVPLIAANKSMVDGFESTILRRPWIGYGLLRRQWAAQEQSVMKVVDAAGKSTWVLNKSKGTGDLNVRLEPPSNSGSSMEDVSHRVSMEGGSVGVYVYEGAEQQSKKYVVRIADPSLRRNSLASVYSAAIRAGLRDELNAMVSQMVDGVRGLVVLSDDEVPQLYLEFEGGKGAKQVELGSAGECWGIRLACTLAMPPGGIAVIEEPETHLHPKAMAISAAAVRACARRGNQVFLTTHSLEYIDLLAGNEAGELLDKMSVYRLQLQDGILKYSRFAGQEIRVARDSISLDLR